MPSTFNPLPPRFDPTNAPGLSPEAREAVTAAFDAMSTWRSEIARGNEQNIPKVIEKVAAAAAALGWPEQIVEATSGQMQSLAQMQVQTMDRLMEAWEEELRSPGSISGSASAVLAKLQSIGVSANPGAASMGTMNPFGLWLSYTRQWQDAWLGMMTPSAKRPPR